MHWLIAIREDLSNPNTRLVKGSSEYVPPWEFG